MSPEEARQVGRRVGEDCAWVAATMQALTDEYQRTTGECDRVHSMPLEGVDVMRSAGSTRSERRCKPRRAWSTVASSKPACCLWWAILDSNQEPMD
jgi:hypothetical protein